MIKKFEDLGVWKDARVLCQLIFGFIKRDDFSKDYALVNQINRSSASIMDNIAEGFGREGNKEFIQFLSISKASCQEVKSQIYRSIDREYISQKEADELFQFLDSLINQIGGFIHYLKQSEFKGAKYKEPEVGYNLSSTIEDSNSEEQ